VAARIFFPAGVNSRSETGTGALGMKPGWGWNSIGFEGLSFLESMLGVGVLYVQSDACTRDIHYSDERN
jgi:hypothetical protein